MVYVRCILPTQIVGIVTVIRFIRSKAQHSIASRHNFNIVKLMLVRDKDDVGFGIDFSCGKIGFDQFVDVNPFITAVIPYCEHPFFYLQ